MDIPKPRFASPCNHCGLCCRSSLCPIGELVFPQHQSGPCPALLDTASGSICKLVLAEQKLDEGPFIQKLLGIGCGCSMADDDTTEEQIAAFDAHSRAVVFGAERAQ